MPDKMNALRLRLCSIVWDLVDLGHIGLEDADEITQRIEQFGEKEIAAVVKRGLETEVSRVG